MPIRLADRIYYNFETLLFDASTESKNFGNDVLYYRQFANNPDLAANVKEDVWEAGGIKTWLTTAETMDIVSDSADDTVSGGTGARVLRLSGVDDNGDLITEIVTLNGLTPVTTTQSFKEINRFLVAASGSANWNVGNITITSSGTATTQGYLVATHSISQQSHFYIPNGYTGFQVNHDFSVYRKIGGAGTRAAEFEIDVFNSIAESQSHVVTVGLSSTGSGVSRIVPRIPVGIPGNSRLKIQATAELIDTAVTSITEILCLKGDFNTITIT